MKKRFGVILMISLFLLSILLLGEYLRLQKVKGKLTVAGPEGNALYIGRYDLTLYGIDKDGTTFFCLPSYVHLDLIDQSESNSKIYHADGTLLEDPCLGEEQEILVGIDGDMIPWRISFLKSENLYSVFIDMTDIAYQDISHDAFTDMKLSIISPTGRTAYARMNALIKGRGNATWRGEKKPYELKLPHRRGLCDMSPSKKWALLANYFEPTKMYNKLAFDVSGDIGLEYSIESDWVDLYANGYYLGNYLLCKEPGIDESGLDLTDLEALNAQPFDAGRIFETDTMKGFIYDDSVDPKTGGYLIEKNTDSYYGHKRCGFRTPYNYFTIKSPDNASYEEVEYISSFVNDIDKSMREDISRTLPFIDIRSFTRRFLIEEIFFNDDAFVSSYYFYKKPDDDKLYAGPVWDYDGTIGEGGGAYLDYYGGTILNQRQYIEPEDMEFKNPLDWDVMLYDNGEYRSALIDSFKENLPVLQDMAGSRIDKYYDKIRASVRMDYAIWRRGWGAGLYESTDDNVDFLKFFLTKRIDYLCRKWDIGS